MVLNSDLREPACIDETIENYKIGAMSKATGSAKKRVARAASHRRAVMWPTRGAGGRILRDGKIKKTTLATISSTSKVLNRVLKRLADK